MSMFNYEHKSDNWRVENNVISEIVNNKFQNQQIKHC